MYINRLGQDDAVAAGAAAPLPAANATVVAAPTSFLSSIPKTVLIAAALGVAWVVFKKHKKHKAILARRRKARKARRNRK